MAHAWMMLCWKLTSSGCDPGQQAAEQICCWTAVHNLRVQHVHPMCTPDLCTADMQKRTEFHFCL